MIAMARRCKYGTCTRSAHRSFVIQISSGRNFYWLLIFNLSLGISNELVLKIPYYFYSDFRKKSCFFFEKPWFFELRRLPNRSWILVHCQLKVKNRHLMFFFWSNGCQKWVPRRILHRTWVCFLFLDFINRCSVTRYQGIPWYREIGIEILGLL